MMNNAYTQYKNQSLSTLAQGELLIKLFDEVIKQCRLGELAIERKDYGATHESLMKAQTIITTLSSSLDMRYPVSKELRELYTFFAKELMDANLNKDTQKLIDIVPLVKDLRNSFAQADRESRAQQAAAGGQAV